MKRSNSDSNNKQRSQNPRAKAIFLEIITFSWILKLFNIGRKRDLKEEDLYTPLNEHTASPLGHKLEDKWRLQMVSTKIKNPSLLKALTQTFGAEFIFYGFIVFIEQIFFRVSIPLLIGGLLSYFNPETEKKDIQYAYKCASGLLLSSLISTVMFHNAQLELFHIGMKIRVACCSIIYKKAFKLSHNALDETTNGHVINLISNDANRFCFAPGFLNFIWIGPMQTIVVTFFLWREIGVSSLFGIGMLIFCFIPLQGWLGKQISNLRSKTADKTDERVRLINEIISGIQVIKMYTWEKPFSRLMRNARKRELKFIKVSVFIKAMLVSSILFQNKLQIFVTMLAYVLLGNYITVQKIFVMISLYSLLFTSMTIFFGQGLIQVAELLVSVKRIQKYLLLEEKDSQIPKLLVPSELVMENDVGLNDKSREENGTTNLNNFGVEISIATAKWTDDQTANCVENVNLTVKPNRLAVIVGPVGSGKSSIIKLILRELLLSKGKIIVRGVVSYASQEPWLFGGSVRQNILFDSPWDEERYREVIKVCALNTDFEQFPCGDQTIVGERGVTLSGGQRARIGLARAVYKKADIYLLDDPLSAVDARVGKHLFEKCIKDFLKEKTRIVITHQVQYLTQADQIVIMEHNLHSSAWYLFISSNQAFALCLDLTCLFYISIVIFSFLLIDQDTYGGNVGLVITQIMGLSGMVQWGIRQSTALENQITSVERVLEYTNSSLETMDDSSKDSLPLKEWPNAGQIVFQNFFMRYSPGSAYVLKNLNFQIKPMEKIGIVGRTGAGKSSIISALFRLALNEGKIIIDGIDTNELGLHELRSKLSIIPQEPFLFSGTMRKNLDPFDEYPDHVLWNALEEVELKAVIENLPGGLNSKMSENGSNFSVGQRQLVCLARAIVRNKKILILDEATANVDPQTDALIQNTIRNKFRSCTVLTIAHRLNTVMDSDNILVMNDGSVVEFGHPYSLLQNKNGFLCSMLEQMDRATTDLLYGVAAESYKCMQERE